MAYSPIDIRVILTYNGIEVIEMKTSPVKHLSVRIEENLLRQFEYAAQQEGRSRNSLLLSLILESIAEFEAVHGEIPEE
jgi:predicted HicB family RNase H-like nuclease